MNFLSFFKGASSSQELPDIYPFPTLLAEFVKGDVETLYARILTDAIERTQGIPEKRQPLLWDNCLASDKQEGLVTMLARAMATKDELFLVYNKALDVIVQADAKEKEQIKSDYKLKGESPIGVFITFKKYTRTDFIKIYASMEYCAAGSLWKSMNISRAVQFKFNDLRASTGLNDKAEVLAQGKLLAEALRDGKDIMLDGKDVIDTAKPDLTAAEKSETFINRKLSKYTGLPASYLTGEMDATMGDSGNKDAKAVERGLKIYFFSIVRPVLEGLFGGKLTFETEDYASITSSNETLKTFDITSHELISLENKTKIINRLYGLDEKAEGDAVVEPEVTEPVPGDPKLLPAPPKKPEPA